MKKRIYRGLGVLVLLLGIVGFLIVLQDNDIESDLELSEETNRLLEEGSKQQAPSEEMDKLSGKSFEGVGHWHDGEWHAEPQAAPMDAATTAVTQPELSEAEIKARVKALREQQLAEYRSKWGENPSSNGSYQHFRDNHGNVVRHYRGTIVVSNYDLIVSFAPTPAELKRYKQLRAALKDAVSKEDITEVQGFQNEIKSLVNAAQGEIPDPVGFGYYGDSISSGQEKILHKEALRSFYQRKGVEHLYELYGKSSY